MRVAFVIVFLLIIISKPKCLESRGRLLVMNLGTVYRNPVREKQLAIFPFIVYYIDCRHVA